MRSCATRMTRWLLPMAAAWALLVTTAQAQEFVLVACIGQNPCTFRRAYSTTVLGKNSVRTVSPSAANDASMLRKGQSVRLSAIPGLYRAPKSGLLRVLSRDGQLGDIVLPSKQPQGATTASAAWAGMAIEYREQANSKAQVSVPIEQVVALLSGPRFEGAVVEFVRRETQAAEPHPLQKELIAGALSFAAGSTELTAWRDALRSTMRRSLDLFRGEGVDPARLEATLAEGLAAMRVHRLIALDAQKEEALQQDLTAEYRRLLERFAIAGAFKNAGMHDAFLEKLDQIGLARWSRPDLVAGVEQSLHASAQWHYKQAKELFASNQYGRAFDEARLASTRGACDSAINNFYYETRVEFVNKNMIPASPDYEKPDKNMLQQIVRELQGIGQDAALTPEGIRNVHERIAEGERRDKDYLPLQLKKAEFLANIGQLTTSRDVVTRVERTVQLGRNAADEWLGLDASLNRRLVAAQQTAEKLVSEQIANGQFKAASATAAAGLEALPGNPRLLYLSAVAAAVQRDHQKARQFVEQYLRLTGLDCTDAGDVKKTLFELYRRQEPSASSSLADERTPNWVSGVYHPAEVFYDPLSGSFQPRVLLSVADKGSTAKNVQFRWDGYMAASITTNVGSSPGGLVGRDRTQLEIEPVYDQKHLYMSGIGGKANSAGVRWVMPLRYLNSPDFDPQLAAKFTGKMSTRGWAGNPFFHPFLWDDIFLFDLVYDDLGRIKEAIPVEDISRPRSKFSEPLKFTWDGSSKRLLTISGAKYKRVMAYDSLGRLVAETITYPDGRGEIEYSYQGSTMQLKEAKCDDNFYERARRIVSFKPRE